MASSLLPPPGLPVTHITRLIVDGGDHAADWDSFELVKRYTNAFVINEDGSEVHIVLHVWISDPHSDIFLSSGVALGV